MGINDRLRQERERLGYSQEVFGAFGGVRKQAQHMYESGSRKPDSDYLEAIAKSGADLLYILLGQRTKPLESKPDEEMLMLAYRQATTTQKHAILGAALGMSSMPATATPMTQKNSGGSNIQIGATSRTAIVEKDSSNVKRPRTKK